MTAKIKTAKHAVKSAIYDQDNSPAAQQTAAPSKLYGAAGFAIAMTVIAWLWWETPHAEIELTWRAAGGTLGIITGGYVAWYGRRS